MDSTSADARVLVWVRARVTEFLDNLRARHGDDPRTRAVLAKLADVRLLADADAQPRDGSWRNGKFRHSTGTLFVAARDPKGGVRKPSSLLKTVVHELAHATRTKEPGEASHSQQWKQTWLWFLHVATTELGWTVDIKCAECTYYGLCDRQQCPKCNW
ncbi:MAG: hypothetical protein EBS48_10085, partial [Actinobacteria bacterium]|nr:hypothetical protein [Actinomycetota bacterium]